MGRKLNRALARHAAAAEALQEALRDCIHGLRAQDAPAEARLRVVPGGRDRRPQPSAPGTRRVDR